MPLPERHLIQLRELLRDHEERLAFLRGQVSEISREIRAHELILSLGQNVTILSVLGDFMESPDAAVEASQDPTTYARQRGIELPEGIEVSIFTDETDVIVSVTSHDDGTHPFVALWHRRDGFSLQRQFPGV
jgi:hypothetical protein